MKIYIHTIEIIFTSTFIHIQLSNAYFEKELCFKFTCFHDDYGYPQLIFAYAWFQIYSVSQRKPKYFEDETENDIPF